MSSTNNIFATNGDEQITTGLAEGLTASSAAQRYAFPDLKTRPIR